VATDLIKGLDPFNRPDFFRLPGVRDDFSGSTPIPDGNSLQSAIVFVGEYPYFISQIVADQPCTLTYEWFVDKDGATLLASSTFNYLTAQGLRNISGTIDSDFLRLTISNASGSDMTAFSHRLKLSPTPNINLAEVELNQEEQLVALADIQTEINDEALANRANETSEHTTTRATIVAEGDQTQAALADVNSELDTQTTSLNNIQSEINDEALANRANETSEHTATRATIESVGEEIETNNTNEHTATRATIVAEGDQTQAALADVNSELDGHTTQLTAIQSEVNDEALAGRQNETAEHTATRAAIAVEQPRIVRSAYDQIGIDAGGRQRVSQLTTLMDGKVVNGHTSLIFESAGTGTHNIANSKNDMSVTAGQWAIFQSKRFYPYFSGKSQVIEATFDSFTPETGLTKRFGYFSSSATSPYDTAFDGVWCESDGSTIRLRMSRAGTSTLNVPITSWSGYDNLGEYQNLSNWDNFTVCIFDFLWLGGAVMRFWVKTQSGFVLAHQFNYSGTAQDIFMLYPCQPMRYEVRSTTGSGNFRYICSQIATEGSFEEDGIVRSVNTGTTGITLSTSGITYPVVALRKQSAFRCVASAVSDFNIFVTTNNDQLLYTLQVNPTLSAGLTYSDVPDSSVQSAIGDGTITVTTEGSVMSSGFLTQNSILPTNLLEGNFLAYMGGTLNNTMDEYVLCATPISGVSNVSTYGSLAYKEF